MYGRRIPLRDLTLSQAQVVDFSRDAGYVLAVRTNGIGVPGYNGGWFRLQIGQKALVFYTGSPEVIDLPTQRD